MKQAREIDGKHNILCEVLVDCDCCRLRAERVGRVGGMADW